jgi:glutamine amidotransferase
VRVGIVKGLSGNYVSVAYALKRVGFMPEYVSVPDAIAGFDRIVLPGVGSFASGMAHLRVSGLSDAVVDYAIRGRPLLGICLGAQLLFEHGSEDGGAAGLGLVTGEVVRFDETRFRLPIPHTGWDYVSFSKADGRAFHHMDGYYYFNHSFHMSAPRVEDTFGWVDYGYRFPVAVRVANVVGYQFHPEKSQGLGLRLLERFLHFDEEQS